MHVAWMATDCMFMCMCVSEGQISVGVKGGQRPTALRLRKFLAVYLIKSMHCQNNIYKAYT